MSIIIERQDSDDSLISLNEWLVLVSSDKSLRIRTSPYLVVDPATGNGFEIPNGVADSEMLIEDQWEPFLRWEEGQLIADDDITDEEDERHIKIVAIAQQLDATIS